MKANSFWVEDDQEYRDDIDQDLQDKPTSYSVYLCSEQKPLIKAWTYSCRLLSDRLAFRLARRKTAALERTIAHGRYR